MTRGKPAFRMSLEIVKQEIDLLSIVNVSHALDYLKFLNETFESFSAGHLKINFKLLLKEDYEVGLGAEVFRAEVDLNKGTDSHVVGLEYLVKQVKTDKFIICDYDVAIICPNWDRIICFLMNQNVVVGTEYPPVGNK